MKVTMIEREISHKLNVAKYESICPTIRMQAILDDGEDAMAAKKQLDVVVLDAWNYSALEELRIVHKRRGGKPVENDEVPALMEHFKSQLSK